ncbi:serine/arginine-rich splicing factor 6 [Corchorus olitorius]|uniref:Serine/arginine-rich splicing factor 6 n=1 Tax=Corchorus olitorius TaxID=93759 RepID=A0A1R3JEH9_9ROSI|nr:serine/arginine-rich splicing factor 6 [Corchorus olitorius]
MGGQVGNGAAARGSHFLSSSSFSHPGRLSPPPLCRRRCCPCFGFTTLQSSSIELNP